MSIKLYYDLFSQPSRAVMLFLQANKIPFEHKALNIAKGEHHSESFEKINPFLKVPTVVFGNFALTESVAILRYLCREQKVADHWYPKDSKQQAKVDEYLEWQHLNTRLFCSRFFLSKFIKPLITGKEGNPERIALLEDEMNTNLDLIEEVWLSKGNQYLAGDQISIADILGACEVEQPRMAGVDARQGRPNLTAWLDRVRSTLNPHYDEVHKKVNMICDKYKGVAPTSPSKL